MKKKRTSSPQSVSEMMAKHGFVDAPKPNSSRVVMAIDGLAKNGKTHFGLTAPRPNAYYDFDVGITRALRHFDYSKDEIRHNNFPYDPKMKKDEAVKLWNSFYDSYMWALESGVFRTVTLDTASAAWELIRLARFGKLTQVKPHHYGPVNAEWRKIIDAATDPSNNTNLLLIHKVGKEYKMNKKKGDDSWTGNYSPKWMNETSYLVEIYGRIYKDKHREPDAGFNMEVIECGINVDLEGTVFTTTFDQDESNEDAEDMCDFPTVAAYATDTDIEDWL